MSSSHRILFIATSDWLGFERLPLHLQEGGFSIAGLMPADTVLDALDWDATFRWREDLGLASSIQAAIDGCTPDLLVFLDERAVRIANRLISAEPGEFLKQNTALLKRSLGRLASFPGRLHRRSLIPLADRITIPPTINLAPLPEMLEFGRAQDWRCIFKLEFSTAGQGIRRSTDEASFRKWAALVHQRTAPCIVQRFVNGRSAERAALALDGGVLCGTSFEKTELSREFGYASVIQPVCHEAMACAVSAFAQEFGLSGFFAGDFVIENETGRAFLIEVNARPITWHHLAPVFGVDLALAVRNLIGQKFEPQGDAVIDSRPLALFPKELLRDRNSRWLREGVHDVPEAYPKLMAFYETHIARVTGQRS